jgi:mono/diheme cytochrome c family protein
MRSTFIVLSLIGLAACAGKPVAREQLTDRGALLFNGYSKPDVDCYKCHGGDGKGAFIHGPDLSSHVPKMDDAAIANIIKNGKGHMPAFGAKLSDAEIADLTTWLRQAFPASG